MSLSIEELKAGNKLIAKFYNDDLEIAGDWLHLRGNRWHVEDYRYHSDWSLLMPVVEKIGAIPICFNVNINSWDGCFICDDSYKATAQGKFFKGTINKTLIYSTWQAVVQFIQWYNKNKQS
jgi:hypothetical protein